MSEWIKTPNVDYHHDRELLRDELPADPIALFQAWFEEAIATGVAEAHGMTLATADPTGAPRSRVVLLKRVDFRGFVFFSHFNGPKGADLDANPKAALSFWWQPMFRQVRISGVAERLPGSESDAYFASRPRASQLGAWASNQSAVLGSRSELETRLREMETRFTGQDVPRPEHWGGTLVVPDQIEFWQGRTARIHDRFVYRRGRTDWSTERLAP